MRGRERSLAQILWRRSNRGTGLPGRSQWRLKLRLWVQILPPPRLKIYYVKNPTSLIAIRFFIIYVINVGTAHFQEALQGKKGKTK
jgi:hypothetical protein